MKSFKALFLVLSFLALIPLVHAAPSTTATGFIAGTSFTFTGTQVADGNTIYSVTVTTKLTGSLTGIGVDYATLIAHADGSFNAQHLSICTCTLAEKSGTLTSILNLRGSLVTHFAEGQWTILSGTGDLTNLRGQGTLLGAPFVGADYSLQIHFEP